MQDSERHIVWTNNISEIPEEDIEFYKKEYPEFSEEGYYELWLDDNELNFENCKNDLDCNVSGNIVVIANIGRWNGRFAGYKELHSDNLKDCLTAEGDYITWYVDKKGDFRCEDTHHDSTNYYLYRSFKPNLSEERQQKFLEKIYYGEVTQEDIAKCTNRVGNKIAKIYGFKLERNCQKGAVR